MARQLRNMRAASFLYFGIADTNISRVLLEVLYKGLNPVPEIIIWVVLYFMKRQVIRG